MKKNCYFEVIHRIGKNGQDYAVIQVSFDGQTYVFEQFLKAEQTYVLEDIFSKLPERRGE